MAIARLWRPGLVCARTRTGRIMPLLRMMMRCLVVTLAKDMTEGAGFSANGTPTFFVGTTTAHSFEELLK